MKILFINLPYYGHVVPTIGLVQELVKQGCQVTYMLPFGWEERIAGSGADFYGYENHRQLAEQMKNAWAAAEKIAEQYDLILYEQFFFLGKHLAEKFDKPAVRVFTAPATNETLMAEYISRGPMSIFRHKWITKAFTKDIAGSIPLKTDNWLDEILQNPPELNLVYTLRQYQPYEEEFPEARYLFLGPSMYERREPEFDFKKGSRPVIYISLGTIVRGASGFFRKCIEAFRDEDVDVIISAGVKFDVRKLKDVPENIHIYPSVPQVEVLHMADVFVTHGGMNSISESLAAEVPMVVIPFASDQPVNADSVERLGAGRRLEYAAVTADSLKQAVLSVMKDEEIRNNLAQIRNEISQAPGNRGGAEAIIRYFEKKVNL